VLHGDAVAFLGRVEERLPVASWQRDGLHLWPLIRTELASRILAAGRPRDLPAGAVRRVRLSDAAALVRDRPGNARVRGPVDIVYLGTTANRAPLDGRWCERFYDPIADLLDDLGAGHLHLEDTPLAVSYRLPRLRPSKLLRRAVLARRMAARLSPGPLPRLEGYELLHGELAEEFPGAAAPDLRQLAEQASAVERLAAFFEGVLARTRPRLVLCTCYYTLVGMALCLAARRSGVPSIDVQHGVTRENPAYAGWTRFPEGGYALLPGAFWCWSPEDAEPMERWPAAARPHHVAWVGGHPWLAYWGADGGQAGRKLSEPDRARVRALRGADLNVLVSLTWSSHLSPVLEALMRAAPPTWRFWIRLHPLMEDQRSAIRRRCRELLGGRAAVDAATDLPLPLLLREADVHLTHNSSVVQEAAALGTPSVVIDERALDVYAAEIASGWARYAAEPAAALEALAGQAARRPALAPRQRYPSWGHVAATVAALLRAPGERPGVAPESAVRAS